MQKVILIVLDGVGCGHAPDAAAYGDAGCNTLGHVLAECRPALPNLMALGLPAVLGLPSDTPQTGAAGRLIEQSAGKDTTTGHWELAGLVTRTPFPVFPNGFPKELMQAFETAIGRGTLGNYASSGTVILEELGAEHLRTGKPIVYTSADSVFQIAAHEGIIPPEDLWGICRQARELLTGEFAVGRVIARPFVGEVGAFKRTGNRRDFSLEPPADTLLDRLKRAGHAVVGIGKIEDIFAHRGLTASDHASGNEACLAATLRAMEQPLNGLIFVNLVDFDAVYGHRNDAPGFARALEAVDRALPEIMARMGEDDLLLLTADHGCDPTTPGTDHTREKVPLLCWGRRVKPGWLGDRESYADVAATVLARFGLSGGEGRSFGEDLNG
ncbi:MAG: phosphopentomutase [Oscillospiraceae bacterium]|jgi:phosphopentomutase|nr:phosphopentomutase [Oscillospiraceae bacterium]